jgi:exodeoxyribonuclease-3|uniref:Endonuclease/exonuclease/phosphatase domain-containing protein n=1 Tax=viral metagenome TaxID=1070528 RepID=A0A6C0EFA9_9ZZZZ
MKIISWNINGLRSLLKKKYLDELIYEENPDILCLSETKISSSNIDEDIYIRFNQYNYRYWHISLLKKGYSGTAILMKEKPEKIIYGLKYKNHEYDTEGRLITLKFNNFYLINVYTPNSGEALNRLDERINVWDLYFRKYISKLQKKNPVIICGDLNVAHNEIDIKNPKSNLKSAGFTIEERKSFDILLKECDLLDIYREIYNDKIEYTYWSARRNCRLRDIGWRIDYFLISKYLKNNVKNINILGNIFGSDHAPIKLIINI